MAWSTITQRNDGQPFGGGNFEEVRDAIFELQDAVGSDVPASPLDQPIRCRMSRVSQNFPTAATTITLAAALTFHENVGGISHVGSGVWTVPVDGVYIVRFALAGGDTIPSGFTCRLQISVGGRVLRMPGTQNPSQIAVYAGWIATTDNVQFQVANFTGTSFASIPSADIMRIAP